VVIDTSALAAILLAESDAEAFMREIVLAPQPCMSAATLVEIHLVVRNSPALRARLDRLIEAAGIEIIPVDRDIAGLARIACDRYGKRRPANLNFGDLFSYATAKMLNMPLLFKGDDFVYTDVEIARVQSRS
jgi:ribonuclease VapC